MRKCVKIFLLVIALFPALLSASMTVSANTFYEGSGTSRARCTVRRTYSSSQLVTMGRAYSRNSRSIATLGIVAGLTPIIGRGLATGAGLIAYHTGLVGDSLTYAGNRGKRATEYYCEKVQWDGYSARSYTKMFVR